MPRDYDIPNEGDIAISPGEDLSQPENGKSANFLESALYPRLTSPSLANKKLKIRVATLLYGLNRYALITRKNKKNDANWAFSEELDGSKVFRQDADNLNIWQETNLPGIARTCNDTLAEVKKVQPDLDIAVQHIEIIKINGQDYWKDHSDFYDGKGETLQTIELTPYHDLWKGQEDKITQMLAQLVFYFNKGQAILSNTATTRVNEVFAETWLTSAGLLDMANYLDMKKLSGFTERELTFWLPALGLSKSKFDIELKKLQAGNSFDNPDEVQKAKHFYAHITKAGLRHFGPRVKEKATQMRQSGVSAEQINLSFMAQLMFTSTEVISWPFFKTYILYREPPAIDKIQGDVRSAIKLMGWDCPELPVRLKASPSASSGPIPIARTKSDQGSDSSSSSPEGSPKDKRSQSPIANGPPAAPTVVAAPKAKTFVPALVPPAKMPQLQQQPHPQAQIDLARQQCEAIVTEKIREGTFTKRTFNAIELVMDALAKAGDSADQKKQSPEPERTSTGEEKHSPPASSDARNGVQSTIVVVTSDSGDSIPSELRRNSSPPAVQTATEAATKSFVKSAAPRTPPAKTQTLSLPHSTSTSSLNGSAV